MANGCQNYFSEWHVRRTYLFVQLEGFVKKCQEKKVCELKRSIYGLKQVSPSWNICFNHAISIHGFGQIIDEPYFYKRVKNNIVISIITTLSGR